MLFALFTVRVRNESGNAENLVSRRIGRFNNKLSLEDICNEVIGESDLDRSINKALDNQQVNYYQMTSMVLLRINHA